MVQQACQVPALASRPIETASLVAPPWHTRTLVGLMLAVATTAVGYGAQATPSAVSSRMAAYLPLAAVNLGLLLYTCRLGLEHSILARVFSQGEYDARRLRGDLAWAAGVALLLIGAESTVQWLLGAPESVAAHALLPRTAGEKLAWVLVAALVGFSEELVYRGYLQRQLAALTGWVPLGVVAQALLFGIAHGEQGGWAVARFVVYALGLGWLASFRKSLLPGVLGHVVVDVLAGLIG